MNFDDSSSNSEVDESFEYTIQDVENSDDPWYNDPPADVPIESDTDDEIGKSQVKTDNYLGIDALYAVSNFSTIKEHITIKPHEIHFTSSMSLNYLKEFKKYFRVILYPNGNNPGNRGYVSIVFERNPDMANFGITLFAIRAIVSVMDTEGNQRFTQSVGIQLGEEELRNPDTPSTFGFDKFLTRETLLNSDDLLSDDKLTLHCSFIYSSQAEEFTEDKIIFDKSVIDSLLGGIFQKNVKDGKPTYSWKVNRSGAWNVFRKRSPYFAKLYEKSMKENRDELLPLEPEDYQAFVNMFYFFFLGDLKHVKNSNEMCQLYIIAERDDVKELKQLCSKYFQSIITTENAAELFVFSSTHNDADLKDYTARFIVDNWLEVTVTDGWTCLMAEKNLAEEVLRLKIQTFITW